MGSDYLCSDLAVTDRGKWVVSKVFPMNTRPLACNLDVWLPCRTA